VNNINKQQINAGFVGDGDVSKADWGKEDWKSSASQTPRKRRHHF